MSLDQADNSKSSFILILFRLNVLINSIIVMIDFFKSKENLKNK